MEESGTKIQISDYDEIFSLLWRELGAKAGQRALDIGVGSKALSSKQMQNQKLKVIGVDVDPDCRTQIHDLGFPIHICDACSLPFKDASFDFSLAFFSMHEINQNMHSDVLKEMWRVSKKVVVVEPLPSSDDIGKKYEKIWKDAMRSVGKFEVYQSMDYWDGQVSNLKPKKKLQFHVKLTKKVTEKNAENFCAQSIEHFRRNGVGERYMDEIIELCEDIKKHGMEHSDVTVIIGFFD